MSEVSADGRAMVPLFDLRITTEELDAVATTLRSGWLTQGPRVLDLEVAFAAHLGADHAVAVSSCTAALHLAYRAVGVGPGDEVIVPSYTFAATASAVVQCGGTPIFADLIGPDDLSVDPKDVEARITPRTKAVAVVHFGGYPAPVRELRELCDRHGVALVEDVAHAPLADVDGQALGTFGDAAAFSFFSNKVLSCGEGGMLVTGSERIATDARRWRSQGMTAGSWEQHTGTARGYDVVDAGHNYRFDEARATLLLGRLRGLPADVEARRARTRRYREALARIPGVRVPYTDASVGHSTCYVMPVLIDPEVRDRVRIALRERHGVQTSLLYPPVHRFVAYRALCGDLTLERTEAASAAEVTLPLYGHLTEEDQDRVVAGLAEELARATAARDHARPEVSG